MSGEKRVSDLLISHIKVIAEFGVVFFEYGECGNILRFVPKRNREKMGRGGFKGYCED